MLFISVREKLCESGDNAWKVRPVDEYTKDLEKMMAEAEVDSHSKAAGNKRPRRDGDSDETKKTKANDTEQQ